MNIRTYLEKAIPAINASIIENDYERFDSFFADDIEEDDLEERWPEVSREHNEELGRLKSFELIAKTAGSNSETRLTFNGVFEKDSAIITVLVRNSNGRYELLEHTYTWE